MVDKYLLDKKLTKKLVDKYCFAQNFAIFLTLVVLSGMVLMILHIFTQLPTSEGTYKLLMYGLTFSIIGLTIVITIYYRHRRAIHKELYSFVDMTAFEIEHKILSQSEYYIDKDYAAAIAKTCIIKAYPEEEWDDSEEN